MPYLGAHLNISGWAKGIKKQCEYLKCETFQIFTKNPRRWYSPPIKEKDVEGFRQFVRESRIDVFVIHSSYLINIATSNKEIQERSLKSLIDELYRGEKLGASALVLHPGSIKGGESVIEGLGNAIDVISRAIEYSEVKNIRIAVENTAGSGYYLGKNLYELLAIVEGVERRGHKIGVCIDTAHAFQSGYYLDKEFMEKIYRLFRERILVFHINDSLTERGSKKDRHAHIGEGHISLDFFRNLLNDGRFSKVPFILEIPGGVEMYKKQLQILRGMLYEKV